MSLVQNWHCTKQISEPQKCIDICANYLFKYFKDLLTQLDAECKYKNSTWFSSTGQIKYFSWKVVIIILYGNFLLGSADNARPLTIAPSHYHFSSFCRPSTLVLWHYCLFKFCLLFFVLQFFNFITSMEVKGITHTLLWYNIIWYNII